MADMISSIAAWAMLSVSVFAIARMYVDRFWMMHLYGKTRYHSCRIVTSMLGLQSKRVVKRRLFKWALFLIGAVAIGDHIQHSVEPWKNVGHLWPPFIALMIGCGEFFGQSRPAAILILGASSSQAASLHNKVSEKLFPHRAVSLLDDNQNRGDFRSGDCFRITFGEWEDVVWRFGRCVLVIVVDTRTMTPNVEAELRYVVREQLQFKTVIVKPAEQVLLDSRLNECCIVESDDACIERVYETYQLHDELPSDHRPIKR